MLLMLKPLRMLLMPLLHKPELRALLLVVLVTVHLLVVAAVIAHLPVVVLVTVLPPAVVVVIAHPLVVVVVIAPPLVVALLLHLLPVVAILLGLGLQTALMLLDIGMVTILLVNKSSDILCKNIRVLLLFIGIRTHCITE